MLTNYRKYNYGLGFTNFQNLALAVRHFQRFRASLYPFKILFLASLIIWKVWTTTRTFKQSITIMPLLTVASRTKTSSFSRMTRYSTASYIPSKGRFSLLPLTARSTRSTRYITSLVTLSCLTVLTTAVLKTNTTTRTLCIGMSASFTPTLNLLVSS